MGDWEQASLPTRAARYPNLWSLGDELEAGEELSNQAEEEEDEE